MIKNLYKTEETETSLWTQCCLCSRVVPELFSLDLQKFFQAFVLLFASYNLITVPIAMWTRHYSNRPRTNEQLECTESNELTNFHSQSFDGNRVPVIVLDTRTMKLQKRACRSETNNHTSTLQLDPVYIFKYLKFKIKIKIQNSKYLIFKITSL